MIPQMLRRLGLGNRLEGRSGQVYYSPVFLGDLRPADYSCLIAKNSPSGVLGISSRKKASEETETEELLLLPLYPMSHWHHARCTKDAQRADFRRMECAAH